MTTQLKVGVDWDAIRRRVLAGESYRSIAKEVDVTHVSISKMARKRGWKVSPRVKAWKPEARVTATARLHVDPQTNSDRKIIAHGKRTPEIAGKIIDLVRRGASQTLAAQSVGIGPSTLSEWLAADPEFRDCLNAARAELLGRQEQNIVLAGDRGDWRASVKLLETAPETREIWGAGRGAVANLAVQINIDRTQPTSPALAVELDPNGAEFER